MLDTDVRARVSLRLSELWASLDAMVILIEVRGEGHHGDRNMVSNETFAGRDKRGTLLGPYCLTWIMYENVTLFYDSSHFSPELFDQTSLSPSAFVPPKMSH